MKNLMCYLFLLCFITPMSNLSAQGKLSDRSVKLASNVTSTKVSYVETLHWGKSLARIPVSAIKDVPEDTFSIYPNPTSGLFEIQLNISGVNKITLHNLSGNIIQSRMVSDNDKIIPFDFSENPAGVYLVKFTTVQGSYIRKIMKED